jgi:hypothetical protein
VIKGVDISGLFQQREATLPEITDSNLEDLEDLTEVGEVKLPILEA